MIDDNEPITLEAQNSRLGVTIEPKPEPEPDQT